MQMVDRLPSRSPGIEHCPVPRLRHPLLPCDVRRQVEDCPKDPSIVSRLEGGDVSLGDDQDMHRRLRIGIAEGERLVALRHFLGRDLASDDTAKDAIAHGHHGWKDDGRLRPAGGRGELNCSRDGHRRDRRGLES